MKYSIGVALLHATFGHPLRYVDCRFKNDEYWQPRIPPLLFVIIANGLVNYLSRDVPNGRGNQVAGSTRQGKAVSACNLGSSRRIISIGG